MNKQGYKHTSLGWLPEDWEIKRLEDISQIQQGISKGRSIAPKDEISVPYMRVANVKDGQIDLTEVKEISINKDELSKYILTEGDILITEGGDPDKLGRGGIWANSIKDCVFQNHLFRIRANSTELNHYYLYNFFQGFRAKTYFLSCAKQTTGIASINSSQVKATPIPLPPLPEQRHIAAILSTSDAGIAKVQQLIEALQTRHRALMQQLLSGKKRLKGFKGGWQRLNIENVANEISSKNKKGNDIIVLSCTKYNGLVPSLEYFGRKIFADDLSAYKIVPKHHFAYATNHIEEGSIGYQDRYDEGLISPMYTVFKTNDLIVNDFFLFRTLKTNRYILEYRRRMEGSIDRRGGLRWDEFSKIKLLLPPLEEQTAIATVLKTSDQEIQAHRRRFIALQQQKKGLMQVLLTGKVRVKPTEA